jgi:Flp pilus assembly protein TadG
MRNDRIRRVTKKIYKAGLPIPLNRNESCRGQTLPEFAMVAMTFFLLTFAVVDFSWMMFTQMNVQDAVREAGRYASTGNHLPSSNPTTPGATLSRVASITQIVSQSAAGANCTPSVSSVSGGVGSAGAPGDVVTITAVCNIPLISGIAGGLAGNSNLFHFTVSSTFKNEPFPAAQTN